MNSFNLKFPADVPALKNRPLTKSGPIVVVRFRKIYAGYVQSLPPLELTPITGDNRFLVKKAPEAIQTLLLVPDPKQLAALNKPPLRLGSIRAGRFVKTDLG